MIPSVQLLIFSMFCSKVGVLLSLSSESLQLVQLHGPGGLAVNSPVDAVCSASSVWAILEAQLVLHRQTESKQRSVECL